MNELSNRLLDENTGLVKSDYDQIGHLVPGLERYVEEHIKPGHFLTAVLQNDLREAVLRADAQSFMALPQLLMFIHEELPAASHGSKEDVSHWLSLKK